MDGFDASTNTIYEFQGCYFHGCPKCYQPNVENTFHRCKMGEIHVQTLDRIAYFRCLNYNVVEMWECAHDFLVKTNDALRQFIANSPIVDKLNPRDAFFGGRTNPSKLHHIAAEGEVIMYCDFVSLYPGINKYGKMPVGHPSIIPLTDTFTWGMYYGLLKCKILPPTKLFHPVSALSLPEKTSLSIMPYMCRPSSE